MLLHSRAFALRAVACVVGALVLAGCGASGSGSSSSSAVKVSGNTLRIHISDPASLAHDRTAQDVVDAERLAFTVEAGEVSDFKLALVLDREPKASDNARAAISDTSAIAYLGEIAPGSSDATAGITNAADLLQVSPTDTALELGQRTGAVPHAPDSYFQSFGTYGRTFARVVPSSAVEAHAQVAEMKALAVHSLYVHNDGSDYGRALALALTTDAHAAGITVATTMRGAGGIFYAGEDPAQAARFFRTAARAAPGAKLFGPSALDSSAFTAAAGPGLDGLYVTIPGFMPAQLGIGGRRFEKAFESAYHHHPNVEAIFGYEAMSALLEVLKAAGQGANDRATVVKDFLGLRRTSSVLGAYRIDHAGNTSVRAFVIARLERGRLVAQRPAPTS